MDGSRKVSVTTRTDVLWKRRKQLRRKLVSANPWALIPIPVRIGIFCIPIPPLLDMRRGSFYAKICFYAKSTFCMRVYMHCFFLIINVLTLIKRHCTRSITIFVKNSSIACTHTKQIPSLYSPSPPPLNKDVCKKYVSMQNPLFVCEFVCSFLTDYQCINPYK